MTIRVNRSYLARYVIWVFVALLIAIPAATNADFRSTANIQGFLQSSGVLAILTMGEAFVLLIAGVDLAVGGAVALGSVAVAQAIAHGNGLLLAVPFAIALPALAGVINGVFVGWLRLPSFIVTFGMLGLEASAALSISHGNRISIPPSSALPGLATNQFLGIAYQIWLALGLLVLGTVFLRYSRFGRYLYAVGGNLEAARLSGIPVRRVLVAAFALSGLFAGIAAVVYASRVVSGDPLAASNLNLQAIAACVIGGVSLFGGRGNLLQAFLGALVYELITNVLNLYGVNPNVTELVAGALILAATFVNVVGSSTEAAL